MKNYIKSIFLIGIFLSFNLSIIARYESNPDNPSNNFYDIAINFATVAATQIAMEIARHEGMHAWQNTKTTTLSLWESLFTTTPPLDCIKHKELQEQQEISSSEYLHDKIQDILEQEKQAQTNQHKLILLYGQAGTGKTTLAKKTAYQTGGNYYHIHQSILSKYSDDTVARFLRSYLDQISDETPEGTISTLHLEEFGQQFGSSGNPITDGPKEKTTDIWKSLLQDLIEYYPKVRVIACSNFGSEQKHSFNEAIQQRAHIIHIDKPSLQARQEYLKLGCEVYLAEQDKLRAKEQTKHCSKQESRNKYLENKYHVTPSMIEQARQKHKQQIDQIRQPWTLATLFKPWTWSTIYQENQRAYNLERQGYYPQILTSNTQTTQDENVIKVFGQITQGKDYRWLNNIEKNAENSCLQQIERMVQRCKNTNQEIYDIQRQNRTCTVTVQGDYNPETKQYTDEEKKITYTYGHLTAKHRLLAAQRKLNQEIIEKRKSDILTGTLPNCLKDVKSKKKDSESLINYAATQTPEEEHTVTLPWYTKQAFAKELHPTNDLVGLTRKALLEPKLDSKKTPEEFRKEKAKQFREKYRTDKTFKELVRTDSHTSWK